VSLRNEAACRVSSFTLVGFIDWLDVSVVQEVVEIAL